MQNHFNDETIKITPPIHKVSVNKNTVAYTDESGDRHIQLRNAEERQRFLSWLLESEQ